MAVPSQGPAPENTNQARHETEGYWAGSDCLNTCAVLVAS